MTSAMDENDMCLHGIPIELDEKISDELSQKRVLNIVDLKNRIYSIINFKEKDNFVEIQKVITRVSKLANKSAISRDVLSTRDYVNTKLFEKDCEFKVFEFIEELEKLFSEAVSYTHLTLPTTPYV